MYSYRLGLGSIRVWWTSVCRNPENVVFNEVRTKKLLLLLNGYGDAVRRRCSAVHITWHQRSVSSRNKQLSWEKWWLWVVGMTLYGIFQFLLQIIMERLQTWTIRYEVFAFMFLWVLYTLSIWPYSKYMNTGLTVLDIPGFLFTATLFDIKHCKLDNIIHAQWLSSPAAQLLLSFPVMYCIPRSKVRNENEKTDTAQAYDRPFDSTSPCVFRLSSFYLLADGRTTTGYHKESSLQQQFSHVSSITKQTQLLILHICCCQHSHSATQYNSKCRKTTSAKNLLLRGTNKGCPLKYEFHTQYLGLS